MILYDEPGEQGKLPTDYVYEKLTKILENEFEEESIRVTCIVYNGIIKNEIYPNGNDCISLFFKSKDFNDSVSCSYPVKKGDGNLSFGDAVVEIIKE